MPETTCTMNVLAVILIVAGIGYTFIIVRHSPSCPTIGASDDVAELKRALAGEGLARRRLRLASL